MNKQFDLNQCNQCNACMCDQILSFDMNSVNEKRIFKNQIENNIYFEVHFNEHDVLMSF
jgi:hypothetical protein